MVHAKCTTRTDLILMIRLILGALSLFTCFPVFCKTEELRECIPYAGPKSIVLEESKSRVYDKTIAVGASCLVNEKAQYTRLYYWDAAPKADLMSAVQIAWHHLRYDLAEHPIKFVSGCAIISSSGGDFPEKKLAMFEYKGETSTNLTLRVYPFKAVNPSSRTADDICLVSVHGKADFLCALYVNVNTGDVDFSFRSASGVLELVLYETHCPFLTLDEYAVQMKLFPPKPERPKKSLKYKVPPRKPANDIPRAVEVEVEI